MRKIRAKIMLYEDSPDGDIKYNPTFKEFESDNPERDLYNWLSNVKYIGEPIITVLQSE